MTRAVVTAAVLVLTFLGAGCDRRDWDDGLARLPRNMIEAACLSADNCVVQCAGGGTKGRSFPHRCVQGPVN
ncbi:MAG: hypothetical protein GY791_18140 [Alphaproteobacteria bacterium]|nr:hypothetical protein [Alphaproteobacteria bacterium]